MVGTLRVAESWSALPADAGRIPIPEATNRLDALALSFVSGVGPTRYRVWAAADGGADRAFTRRVTGAAGADARQRAERSLDCAGRHGASLVLLGDRDYPPALLDLDDPPATLWCLGDVSLLRREPAVAIVGTRAATPYGARVTTALARAVAERGVVVVSGLARGVDAAAHQAALDGGGPTIAVLGTGVDVPYPASHRALYRQIVDRGLVVSEMEPGTRPTPGAFPRRNRIVAALASATLVTEAGTKSGALITASLALELGRDVAAVPGLIDSLASAGTNALLRDGATLVADARDLLDLVGLARTAAAGEAPALEPVALSDDERDVWTVLATPAFDLDALAARTSLDGRRCAAAVGMLEAMGHVRTAFDGSIARR